MHQPSAAAVIVAVLLLLAPGCSSTNPNRAAAQSDALEAGFKAPPDTAKPWTWWHWVSGNVSREGITKDLEAMKRIGLGGAQLFSVDQIPDPKDRGKVFYMSPEWRDLTLHAIREADRLGLELALVGCEGWSESGGPWITPELSMQKIVWSEQRATGPTRFADRLPQPETIRDHYRDIRVFAFPAPPGENAALASLNPKVTTTAGQIESAKLFDRDPQTTVTVKATTQPTTQPVSITIELAEPLRASGVTLSRIGPNVAGEVQVSDDGKTFRRLGSFTAGRREKAGESIVFDEVHARHFRIHVPKAAGRAQLVLGELEFTGPRLPDYRAKTAMESRVLPARWDAPQIPAEAIVQPDKIIDLTDKLDKTTGRLEWDVPAGTWTILRIGHTSTGRENHPTMVETRSLECDKMSKEAIDVHFNGMIAKVRADAGDLAGKSLNWVLLDSWEAGTQNWTPRFAEEFKSRRGYDPTPWLPAMSGRVIESAEKTERFLWDVRRTIADLTADIHYGHLRDLLHQNNMKLTAEAVGISMPTIADQLQAKGRTDMPMGEFWVGRVDDSGDTKEAASGAHIYDKPYASAEAWTATPEFAAWKYDPFMLKAQGDKEMTMGINRMVFHRYAHQPDERKPGITMGPWGTNFERTNTWWEPGKAWMSYLSRCQHLLQRGKFVADIVYYYGEDTPRDLRPSQLKPPPPPGYDYDACNAEILLTKMSVKDGRLVLPHGMSYRALVLPDTDRMTLAVARKVKELIDAGATVVGPRPAKSPSLVGFPSADEEVRTIGDAIAPKLVPFEKLTEALKVAPDFESPSNSIRFIHRRDGDADIYFVSNQKNQTVEIACTFRVADRAPEFWHPDTGRIEPAMVYTVQPDGRTTIPIRLDPSGSVFVVFRKRHAPSAASVVSVTRDGKSVIPFDGAGVQQSKLTIRSARYGVLANEPQTADVTAAVTKLLDNGTLSVTAGNALADRDPAVNVRKQLRLEYSLDGKEQTATIDEGESLDIPSTTVTRPLVARFEAGRFVAYEPGKYELRGTNGVTRTIDVPAVASPATVEGAWDVSFPAGWGAPASVTMSDLASWTTSSDDGIKHFSGTATYKKRLDLSADQLAEGNRLYLDLGQVKNLAEVTLNGKNLGVLWKPPFRLDITDAAKAGANELEVKITNLWPNRLIGDQKLPADKRYTWTSYNAYKADSPLLESGLLGPVKIVTGRAER